MKRMVSIESTCDIVSIGGVLIGLIHAIFYNIRRSRCKSINCLCIKCSREVMTLEEMSKEIPIDMTQV